MSFLIRNLRLESSRVKPVVDTLIGRSAPPVVVIPCRTQYYNNRHRDPKYRKERSRKMWPIDLPDFYPEGGDKKMSPEEMRSKFKEKGVAPPRNWDEREIFLPCTMSVYDPYQPTSDEKSSSLTDKLKSPLTMGKDAYKNRSSLGQIKDYEGDEFDAKVFAKAAYDIYVKAHECLAAKDESRIFDYVTERCFPVMAANIQRHTIHWKCLGEIEPPHTVRIRTSPMLSKTDLYAQITVRMHTSQILAIYDRHGRLVHGSPTEPKDVLEYIVFEKFLEIEGSLWRMHERIRPPDCPPFASQITKTYALVRN